MRWLDSVVPMKTPSFWHTPLSYFWAMDGEEKETDEFDCFATTNTLDAKYEKIRDLRCNSSATSLITT